MFVATIAWYLTHCLWATNTPPQAEVHPYHVSLTQIQYNPSDSALELSVRWFTDDIELAMQRLGHQRLRLGEPQEPTSRVDSLFNRYIHQHLSLQGSPTATTIGRLDYLGHETTHGETWAYLLIKGVGGAPTFFNQGSLYVAHRSVPRPVEHFPDDNTRVPRKSHTYQVPH